MNISIASGKGGTGKTTIAVNLALSLENKAQLLDCDVEEPNAALFLNPVWTAEHPASIPVPVIDRASCNFCGRCQEVCAYNAIAVLPPKDARSGQTLVFPHLCHGCGACVTLCPQGAIKEEDKLIGLVQLGEANGIQLVQGLLNVGEAMAPPVIRKVKEYLDPRRVVILDAPPGTSCPMMTAARGTDFCVLVTEPTPFGLNDLILAVESVRKLGIPMGVVINRSDLGDDRVEEYCRREGIDVMLRIPFSRAIAEAYAEGIPLVRVLPEYADQFRALYQQITKQGRP